MIPQAPIRPGESTLDSGPSTLDSLDQTLSALHFHPLLRLAIQEANLSQKEQLLLSLSLQGFSRRQIASHLGLSHTRVIQLFRKISQKVFPKLPFPPIYI